MRSQRAMKTNIILHKDQLPSNTFLDSHDFTGVVEIMASEQSAQNQTFHLKPVNKKMDCDHGSISDKCIKQYNIHFKPDYNHRFHGDTNTQ